MQNPSKIPRIQFNVSGPYNPDFGWIKVGGEAIHRIADIDEFYTALGYNHETRRTGELPEEFIWAEYIKENSMKSAACLQVKLLEYLKTNSVKFNEKYGAHYESWLGGCLQSTMLNSAD